MLWRRLRAGADPRPTPAPSATRAASGCSRGVRGCRCTPNESSRQRGEVGHALGAEQVGAATLRQSSNDNRVVTRNSTAVAVVPRPNLKPYFFCAASPGGRQPGRKSAYWRKRRGSVLRLPSCQMGLAAFASPTCELASHPVLVGHLSVSLLNLLGIAPAFAS
jgi:hypothetical protein